MSNYDLFSDYEVFGKHVAPDWRYQYVSWYLQASPSYRLAERSRLGKSLPTQLPVDFDAVLKVYDDFGMMGKELWLDWWTRRGIDLYGVAAPRPEIQIAGQLTEGTPKLVTRRDRYDAVVLVIPKNLTMAEVLRQLTAYKDELALASELPPKLAPAYKLCPSKLREDTLVKALVALSKFERGVPLWRIGNDLELNGQKCIPDELLKGPSASKFAQHKEQLAIAARRMIRKGILIAENAARGRFPCDKPFAEAIVGPYKREAGRPPGRKKKTRV